MHDKTTGKPSRRHALSSLFGPILSLWDEYHRPFLVLAIAISLAGFLASLSSETRRNILTGLFEQRSLVILLFVFNLLTLSLLWSVGQRLDTWIFLLFNLHGYHPLWLDRIMWVATQIGNGFVGLLLGAALYFVDQRRLAIEFLSGILSLWLGVEIVKTIVERTRPFLSLEGARVIGWRERGKSFPSGHTAQAFLMTTLVTHHFLLIPWIAGLLYAIAAFVAFTRIYVGAHYPRDVIAGAVLGSVWGLLTGLIEAYITTHQF